MSELLNKTPQEAIADAEAAKDLYLALLEAFKSLAEAFAPGLTASKKKPLTVEVKKRSDRREESVDAISILQKEKPVEPENPPEYGLIYGLGVNKLTAADCKTIAAIVTAKKGASIVGSDYDYVIRHNGKVLFETTMGEVTTHTRLPDVLHDKIVNLEAGTAPSPTPPVNRQVLPSPEHNPITAIKDAVTARAVADTEKLIESVKEIEQRLKDLITERGNFLDGAAVKPFKDMYRQLKKGVFPEPEPAPSIDKFMDGVNSMFDAIDDDEKARSESIVDDGIDNNEMARSEIITDEEIARLEPQPEVTPTVLKKAPAKSSTPKGRTKTDESSKPKSKTTKATGSKGRTAKTPAKSKKVDEKAEVEAPSTDREPVIAEIEAPSAAEEPVIADLAHPNAEEPVVAEVEAPSTAEEPVVAEVEAPIGRAMPTPPRDLQTVQILFTIFGRNTNKEEHNTSDGRAGILELPTGAKLVNKIDSGIVNLSLVRGETEYQLGSYNPNDRQYSVHSGLDKVRSELTALKPHLDLKTWTIKAAGINPQPVVNQQAPKNPAPKPPVTKQNKTTVDLNNLINVEAEEALLAKILTDEETFEEVIKQGISDRSFAAPLYQQIFKASQSISTAGRKVNLMNIASAMSTKSPDIYASIATIVSRDISGSVDSFATIVREKQIQRDLYSTAASLRNDVSDLAKPVLYSTKENLKTLADINTGKYQPIPPIPNTQPHTSNLKNIQLEQEIISALLQAPATIASMTKIGLTSKCFDRLEHQQIYATAVDLHARGEEVNLLSVRNRLSTEPEAAAMATNLVESALPMATKTGVNKLITLSQRRDLVELADRLTTTALKPRQSMSDLTNIISDHQTAIKEIEDRSPKLPELTINESQPEFQPESQQEPQVNKSRGR